MKKKSTLLVVLLSFVCVVCAAIGLTACNSDNGDDTATVIKVGETNIGTVGADGVTFDVEGDFEKEYVVTAKVGNDVCDSVLIQIPGVAAYAEGTYGTFEFVNGKDYKIQFSSATTVENVKVTMAEKTYPVGSIHNPIALTLDTEVTYSVGFEYVWYSVTPSEEGTYEISFGDNAGKIDVVYGDTINGEGDFLLEGTYYETSICTFDANKTYYIGIASAEMTTLTGTFKVTAYTPAPAQPVDKGALTVGTDKAIDSIDSIGITVTINVTEGKTYTITALKDSATCSDVYIFVNAGHNGNGTVSFYATAEDAANAITVKLTASEAVSGITLQLTESAAYPALTLGSNTIAFDGFSVIYTLVVAEDGDYSFTGDAADFDIGTALFESLGGMDIDETLDSNGDGVYHLTAGTTYYLAIYTPGSLNIAKN